MKRKYALGIALTAAVLIIAGGCAGDGENAAQPDRTEPGIRHEAQIGISSVEKNPHNADADELPALFDDETEHEAEEKAEAAPPVVPPEMHYDGAGRKNADDAADPRPINTGGTDTSGGSYVPEGDETQPVPLE